MRKRLGLVLMCGGLLLAVVAAFMVMTVSNNARRAAAQVKQVQVVVTTTNIPQGTEVTASMLTTKPFPAEFVPDQAVSSVQDAVGRYSASNIVSGQIVTAPLLSTTKQAGQMSYSIPKGMVAYPLPATDLLTAGGAIQPGDHVNVLVTFNVKMVTRLSSDSGTDQDEQPSTQQTLQNIQVLDVLGKSSSDSSTSTGSSGGTAVVLLVTPQQAVTLKLAKDSGGMMDLALLPAKGGYTTVATDGETIDSEMVKYKFRKPQPLR